MKNDKKRVGGGPRKKKKKKKNNVLRGRPRGHSACASILRLPFLRVLKRVLSRVPPAFAFGTFVRSRVDSASSNEFANCKRYPVIEDDRKKRRVDVCAR